MSRKIEEVSNEYSRAAMELGDLRFKQQLAQDNLEELEYNQRKLINKMESLAKEAKAINEELSKATVALPPVAQESKDEAPKA